MARILRDLIKLLVLLRAYISSYETLVWPNRLLRTAATPEHLDVRELQPRSSKCIWKRRKSYVVDCSSHRRTSCYRESVVNDIPVSRWPLFQNMRVFFNVSYLKPLNIILHTFKLISEGHESFIFYLVHSHNIFFKFHKTAISSLRPLQNKCFKRTLCVF